MSSLRHTDRIILEKLFEMDSGYVCDFSDRTFKDFVLENTNIDVYTDKYAANGTSKANRLRTFWKIESNDNVSKLIENMLEYWRVTKIASSSKFQHSDEYLYEESKRIVRELKEGKVTEQPSSTQVNRESEETKNVLDDLWEFKPSYFGFSFDVKRFFKHFVSNTNSGVDSTNEGVGTKKVTMLELLSVLAAVATILGLVWAVYTYYFPRLNTGASIEVPNDNSTTSTDTPDLSDIFKKSNSLGTSLEKQNLIDNYKDSTVNGSGSFTDISRSGSEGYIVEMTIERNAVGCRFGTSSEKTLLLLNKGDTVNFSGTFTGGGLAFGSGAVNPWYIIDCVLR